MTTRLPAMSAEPPLRLDSFSLATTVASAQSPFAGFTSQSYNSPYTPGEPSFATSPEKSGAPLPPSSPPKIVMGAIVNDGEDEKEYLLEVPGIVLTEPPLAPTRRPSPPPKQTVLLAPTSLPLPCPDTQLHTSQSSISAKSVRQFSPAFLSFLNGTPLPSSQQAQASQVRRSRLKAAVLLAVVVVGGWHLWSTMVGDGWGVEGSVDGS
ncbi:uncharacterized protein L203_104668 [Cryptococcus depauperatus CBS 7841]|uniref:Transmembrane protein n=1 Tax=Cryptococcus depauperatus CBS 7841 TaxID=1295531 RepID=A0AAJ8M2F6_9TREE